MESVPDQTTPVGRWAFDESVTAAFDDMLQRSIPDYEAMRRSCFTLGSLFVTPKTDIVDLGCSRGEAVEPFIRRFGVQNRYVGVEVSPPMVQSLKDRFSGFIDRKIFDLREDDLRRTYPPVDASLTLCILTLQFTPIEHRLRIIRDIYNHTRPGGALVIVEKIIGATADLDARMVDLYYAMKAEHGYDATAIERKRLSLEGVLVPVTAKWNEEMLAGAGFREVDCFWRWMNFAGWIAVR